MIIKKFKKKTIIMNTMSMGFPVLLFCYVGSAELRRACLGHRTILCAFEQWSRVFAIVSAGDC